MNKKLRGNGKDTNDGPFPITWPNSPREHWEVVDDETIAKDAFQQECFKLEYAKEDTTGEDEVHLTVNMQALVIVPKKLFDDELDNFLKENVERGDSQKNAGEFVANLIMERLMLDLNLSLLPVIVYKTNKFLSEGKDAPGS